MTPVEASRPPDGAAEVAGRRLPTDTPASDPPVLEATGLFRRFGATQALRDVRLSIGAGEIHALLGENGAGKSTLIKILVGALQPDRGTVRAAGEPVHLRAVGDAVARGIVPVYQQLSLLPDLSIAENLFAFEAAAGPGWRRSGAGARIAESRSALETVGLALDPRMRVGELSLAERQLVEIARAVVRDCRVLILDEPTAALGRSDVQHLFAAMRRLRDAGRSVLFISHRLDEVAEIADRITVIRNGATVVDGAPATTLSRDRIVEAMAGSAMAFESLERGAPGEVVLRAEGVTGAGAFEDVDLEVRAGEVLGIVGLIGAGAMELAEALAGGRSLGAGRITVNGRRVRPGDRAAAMAAGIGYVPGDREREGIFPARSVSENASASALGRVSRWGLLRRRLERALVDPALARLDVRPADSAPAITALSGGNQQKVLVLRSLAVSAARALVAVEPTRGVDVAARHDIHRAILAAAADGMAVVLASTDLDEVRALSHRILVMRAGSVAAELDAGATAETILARLTGAVA